MKHFTFIKSLLVILFIAGIGYSGSGQIPETFSFQMFITDNTGNPVPDGTYNVSLSFYTTPSGGLPALTLDQETISVSGGLANIVLGGQSSLNLPVHSPLYVGLSIGGGDEMTPRMPVIPSFQSQSSRSVFGDSNIFPSEGPVGIGILNPSDKLEVDGDVKITGGISLGDFWTIDIPENVVVQDPGSGRLGTVPFDLIKESTLTNISSLEVNGNFSVLDSSGSALLKVVTPSGNSYQIGSSFVEGDLQVGTDFSHFYAKNDGEFGIKNNDEDVLSFNSNGFGTIGGGLRIGLGSSYANVDQNGKIDIVGESGTAVTLAPNGASFFFEDVNVRKALFLGGSDIYSIFNGDGTGGVVNDGHYVNYFDNLGNTSQSGAGVFGRLGIGTQTGPNVEIFSDAIFLRDSTATQTISMDASGNVEVINLYASGTKGFKIDHPLDPENKYLIHQSIESSERLNLYNGNIILNNNGEAEVELPAWFEELNEDYRYQLTAIGAPGPNLYIAQKINNNIFKISGGTADMEVSWQVTGKRKDKYANNQRALVEVLKESPELSAKFKME